MENGVWGMNNGKWRIWKGNGEWERGTWNGACIVRTGKANRKRRMGTMEWGMENEE